MTALVLRKLPFSSRALSNCSLERVLIRSPPATSHSQRTPETPRATHCFGVQLVPRLRQHFIHPRLVHESDEAETPAPRSEGEADGYKGSEWPRWKGRAQRQGEVSETHLDLLVRGSRITRHSFTSPNWPKYSRSPSVTTHPPSDQPRPGALPPPPPSFAPGDPSVALPPPRQAARALSPLPPPTPLHSPRVPVEPSWRPPGSRGGKGRAGLEWGTALVGFPPLREPPYKSLSRRCERSWSCRWRVPGAQPAPTMPLNPPSTAPQPEPGRARSPSVLRSRGPRGGARKRARGRPGSAGRRAGQGRPGLGRRKGCRVAVRGRRVLPGLAHPAWSAN